MTRIFYIFLSILIVISSICLFISIGPKVYSFEKNLQAKKIEKKKPKNSPQTTSDELNTEEETTKLQEDLSIITENGTDEIYGSILDPNVNQILLLLPKPLLNQIRKLGTDRYSVNLNSTLDSTKTYMVSPSSLSIERKIIKSTAGKTISGKFLVANFFNISTTSGITVPPSSLPGGNYKLRVKSDESEITTKPFKYYTPVLIVGNVDSNSEGFINVEDLNGNIISEKTVAISPNGTFLTEVRANKVSSINLTSREQTTEGSNTESIKKTFAVNGTGVVHAITNKDLYAIVPLSNNVERNTLQANKPIEINESSTLTANIGKEYKELAEETAKEELEDLETQGAEEFEGFGCDIYSFSDRCSTEDTNEYVEIGKDFKDFIKDAHCMFPEFNLIKEIVLQSPEEANEFIGKGYCENALSSESEEKPCTAYSQVLKELDRKSVV